VTTRHSRRQLLQVGAAALISAGLWPGALRAADDAAGEFHFLCVNDVHCMDEESGRWLESRVIRPMKESKIAADFCLIVGDLAEKGTRAELAMVRDAFKTLGIPVHVVPGNHDYAGEANREAYDELFPKQLNYVFEHKGWQFVGLDSTQGSQYTGTSVQPATLAWMDEAIKKLDKSQPTVAFTHFPLGEKVTYRPKNAEDVLKRLMGHNLRAVLNGHFHGDTKRDFGDAAITTSRCCALKRNNHDKSLEKGYLLCHAKDGKISREFVEVKGAL
jgi:3',5'-cyclic AMP phosphodiesterase CpdA